MEEHDTDYDLAETLLTVFAKEEAVEKATHDLVAWMRGLDRPSALIESLLDQYDMKGWLSEKQIELIENIRSRRVLPSRVVKEKAKVEPSAATPAPPTISARPGFYRDDSGRLYRLISGQDVCAQSDGAPDEFGESMRWYSTGEALPDNIERLTLDNVVGFGMIYGTCIVCGEPVGDDNAEGIHAHCAFRLPTLYSYIPEPRT